MKAWKRFVSWMRALLRRSRMESEMDAELRFHIEAFAEDLVRNGVPREEALRRARIEFGGVERAKERSEEHTSELQSQSNIVCRLLLEKKKRELNACERDGAHASCDDIVEA